MSAAALFSESRNALQQHVAAGRRQIRTPSTTSCWPTMILPISWRTRSRRVTVTWRSDSVTFIIVSQQGWGVERAVLF